MRVLSKEAEAKRFPSFENFTHETARVWAVRVLRCRYGLYVVWFVGVVPLLDMVMTDRWHPAAAAAAAFGISFNLFQLQQTTHYYFSIRENILLLL